MQRTHKLSHCRLCGKKLPALRKLFSSTVEFCDDSHRSEFASQQNDLGLARLLEGAPRSAAEMRWERCAQRMQSKAGPAEFGRRDVLSQTAIAEG